MSLNFFSASGRGLAAIMAALALAGCATLEPAPTTGVQIGSHAGRLSVSIDGRLFTEYRYAGLPQPILYPILGPTGQGVTRNFPMASPPGEEHDHPHHRSFWFAHGLVNGQDFWTDRPGAGRIVHDRFLAVRGGAERGLIHTRNHWVAANGKILCTDERRLTFYHTGTPERMFDFEITLHADHGDVVLGDTREGTFAVRVAETMRVMPATGGPNPNGHIVNSEGARDQEAWGKRARWCDYSGPVNGSLVGIAIFDHPKNPRHPTWWMVRDYGLLAANPFGQHEFERLSNEHVGDLRIPAGERVTFRYRILIHPGTAEDARVAERYAAFVAGD